MGFSRREIRFIHEVPQRARDFGSNHLSCCTAPSPQAGIDFVLQRAEYSPVFRSRRLRLYVRRVIRPRRCIKRFNPSAIFQALTRPNGVRLARQGRQLAQMFRIARYSLEDHYRSGSFPHYSLPRTA
jgi:hypothetical protein